MSKESLGESENEGEMKEESEESSEAEEAPAKKVIPCISTVYHTFNVDMLRNGNMCLLDDNNLLFSVGNTLLFFDITKQTYTFSKGQEDGGVGAICILKDPENMKTYVAVGNRGIDPCIYVHEYPSMNIVKVLKNGTERGYTAINFDKDGEKLASVGAYPDFTLTIWNWREEKIILRNKAFGQDIFKVEFSPSLEGQLTTSGVGHIKFWKMSQTFTGLKLKGEVGKFGKVDISDIVGFCQFPDGKVLSGSEQGHLILWEENLVKVILIISEDKSKNEIVKCHDGLITQVNMVDRRIMTTGNDGFIKFWDFDKIDTSEPSDTSYVIQIKPESEFKMENVNIVSLNYENRKRWIVKDGNGGIWKMDHIGEMEISNPEKIYSFISGKIVDADTSHSNYLAVCGAEDGTIMLVDYFKKEAIARRKFNSGVSKVVWVPKDLTENSEKRVMVGFENGVVRMLEFCKDNFMITRVFKPHDSKIVSMGFSFDNKYFMTVNKAKSSQIWFFKSEGGKFNYIGFVNVGKEVRCATWGEKGLVIALKTSELYLLDFPEEENKHFKRKPKSYEIEMSMKKYLYYQFVRPPKRKKKKKMKENEFGEMVQEIDEEAEEEERKKEEERLKTVYDVINIMESRKGGIFLSLDKPDGLYRYSGLSWEGDNKQKEQEYPLRSLSHVESVCTSIKESVSGRFMIVGYRNGKVRMIEKEESGGESDKATVDLHDESYGVVTSAKTSFDDQFLVSVGEDSCFFVHRVQSDEKNEEVEEKEYALDGFSADKEDDITKIDAWSIEEGLLKTAEIEKKSKEESIKEERRKKIEEIKLKFMDLKKKSGGLISKKEMQIDKRLEGRMEEKLKRKIEQVYSRMRYETEKVNIGKKKLEDEFLNCLEYERIVVRGFENGIMVATFKTEKMRPELVREIEKIRNIISQELQERQKKKLLDEQEKMERSRQKRSSSFNKKKSPLSLRKRSRKQSSRQRSLEKTKKKVEALEKSRMELKNAREMLTERKNRINEVDPELLEKIQYIENNLGDYKLRMSPDYVVPEHKRMTAEKKFTQMILLEESMFNLKTSFNKKLLGLRDLKINLIENFAKYNRSIQQINKELGVEEEMEEEKMMDDEVPERRNEIKESDLQRHIFELEQEKKKNDNDGGYMNFTEKATTTKTATVKDEKTKDGSKGSGRSKGGKSMTLTATRSMVDSRAISIKEKSSRDEITSSIHRTNLEKSLAELDRKTKVYEKNRLMQKKKETKEEFDSTLLSFRVEKFKLEADLKQANLKLYLLYQELQLLKQFELKDRKNYEQLNEKRVVKAKIMGQIQECQRELLEKKKEIKALVKKEKISTVFEKLVPASHPEYASLKEIFNKSKKDTDSDYSDDEMDDSDLNDDEDEDDEENDGEEKKGENELEEEESYFKKPSNCSEEIFKKVLDLRVQKIKQDELLDSISRSVEKLKKRREQLSKQKKSITSALRQINSNIEIVQKEKQNELNQIKTLVVLKLNQIKSLVKRRMPSQEELVNYVVFTNKKLKDLAEKENQVKKERERVKKNNSRLRSKLKGIRTQHKVIKNDLLEVKKKVKEFQLLKFGQEVEYEELISTVDPQTEILKKEISKIERGGEVVLKKQEAMIKKLKQQLSNVTRNNTKLLEGLAEIRQEQQTIEKEIDNSQTKMIERIYKGMENKEKDRMKNLKKLVVEQAKKIENFRNEVAILRSKSTHVYTQ